tara:strand:+ start:272 stop:913 length:642 start_codon:yes stop_codon:yes gene_type:complete
MRSLTDFIVTPVNNKRYINTKKIGDVEMVVSSSQEDHRFSNREAIVVETPLNYKGPIAKGDTLLVHHNVFKYYNDIKGRQKSGRSFLKDNVFLIDSEQFFLYKHKGEWKTYDRYCFVKPIKTKKDMSLEKFCEYEPLMGIMEYPNDYLKSQGLKRGDTVSFKPYSEYIFYVNGEKLYRVYDHQITIKLNGLNRNKTRDNKSGKKSCKTTNKSC